MKNGSEGITSLADIPDWFKQDQEILEREELEKAYEKGDIDLGEEREPTLEDLLNNIYWDKEENGSSVAKIKGLLGLDEETSRELDAYWNEYHGGIPLEEANPGLYNYLSKLEETRTEALQYETEIAEGEREAEKELTQGRAIGAIDQTGDWKIKQGWRGGVKPRPHDKSRLSKQAVTSPDGEKRFINRPDTYWENVYEKPRRERRERDLANALYGEPLGYERHIPIDAERERQAHIQEGLRLAEREVAQEIIQGMVVESTTYTDGKGVEHEVRSIRPADAWAIREAALKRVDQMTVGEVLDKRDAARKRREEEREKWDIPSAGQFSRGGADDKPRGSGKRGALSNPQVTAVAH